MPGITIREGDSFEAALKKFKKQCEKAGVLAEVRKREAYEKPSVKRKRKSIAARKRGVKHVDIATDRAGKKPNNGKVKNVVVI